MAEKNTKNIAIEEESFVEVILRYAYVIIKYKRVVLITAIVAMPLIYFCLRSKEPEFRPKYKTTARIRVMAKGLTEGVADSREALYAKRELTTRVKDLATLMKSTVVLENAVKKTYNLEDKNRITLHVKDLQNEKIGLYDVETELNYIDINCIGYTPQESATMAEEIIEATREELLNSKKLVVKEALESLEKQLKEVSYDLEQTKLNLTKFIVENEVLSEAIEIKEGEGRLTEDVDKLALHLVDIRSQITKTRDFIKETQNVRDTIGDIEGFKLLMHKDKKLVDVNLLEDLSRQQTLLNKLLLINKEEHPDVIKAKDRLEQIKLLIPEEIDSAIDSLKRNSEALKAQEEKMANLIEKGLSKAMIEYTHLQRNVTIKERLAQKIIDSLEELSLASKLIDVGTFTVIDPPTQPKSPFNLYEKGRTFVRYFLFSIISGLGAGIGIAISIDYFGMAVKDIHEIEEVLDRPILGEIPAYEGIAKEQKYLLPLKNDSRSVVSEAFKGLRTNIKFRCVGKEIKTLLLTSLVPEEGKTFICANLAAAFAQTDKRILVIDCDLRKSALHKYYNLENKKGISQLIDGEENIKPVDTEIPNLSILVAGKHPSNPAELLASDTFDKVLASLKQKYDMIIVDSPPLFAVTDSTILIKKLDTTILAIRANITPKKAVRRATKLGEDIQSKILGIAFNGIETRKGKYGSYYYYKYDYYGQKEKEA